MTTAADIDAMLTAPKTLAGVARWIEDERGSVAKLSVPVAQAGIVGGSVLRANATLHTDPQRGGCVLIYEGRPIQRMSYRPDHAHANPFASGASLAHRGLRLDPNVSRLHPWRLNRVWPRPLSDNVAFAERLEPEPLSLEAALAIFLGFCAIIGDLPPPPWEPRLL